MAKSLSYKNVIHDLSLVASKDRAMGAARYFKTGKNDYGEGDIFIGVTVPAARIISKKYLLLPIADVLKLLKSKIHEHRFTALLILGLQYAKQPERQKEILDVYLSHTRYINNWDLVDTSARDIVGHYVWNYLDSKKRKTFLSKLANSELIWERRISIVSTHYGIMKGKTEETLAIAALLIKDTHDLLHKATGWMLREVGKKDINGLRGFLDKYASIMPRTMLRYALEHFAEKERFKYMKMKLGVVK